MIFPLLQGLGSPQLMSHTSSCESTFNLWWLEVLRGDSRESNGRHGVLMKAPRWFSNVSPGFFLRWWFTILAKTLLWSIVHFGCQWLLRQTWSFTFESMIICFLSVKCSSLNFLEHFQLTCYIFWLCGSLELKEARTDYLHDGVFFPEATGFT